jgi:hypothetical protein
MVSSSIPGTWTGMVRLQRKNVLAVLAISLVVVEYVVSQVESVPEDPCICAEEDCACSACNPLVEVEYFVFLT